METLRKILGVCFLVAAITSLFFEPVVMVGYPLSPGVPGVTGALWWWYASHFDPLFLQTPGFMQMMCWVDFAVFGPLNFLLSAYLFRDEGWFGTAARRMAWVFPPFAGAVAYSTLIYFLVEFQMALPGTNFPVVVLINAPYLLAPLALLWYLGRAGNSLKEVL